MEICALHLDARIAAIPMESVREVIIRPRLSRLPLSPPSLAGLVGFRGGVIPVAHLDRCLGDDPDGPRGARNRAVIAQTAFGLLGLLVDQVGQLEIDPPPPAQPDSLTRQVPAAGRSIDFIHLDPLVQHLKETWKPVHLPTAIAA